MVVSKERRPEGRISLPSNPETSSKPDPVKQLQEFFTHILIARFPTPQQQEPESLDPEKPLVRSYPPAHIAEEPTLPDADTNIDRAATALADLRKSVRDLRPNTHECNIGCFLQRISEYANEPFAPELVKLVSSFHGQLAKGRDSVRNNLSVAYQALAAYLVDDDSRLSDLYLEAFKPDKFESLTSNLKESTRREIFAKAAAENQEATLPVPRDLIATNQERIERNAKAALAVAKEAFEELKEFLQNKTAARMAQDIISNRQQLDLPNLDAKKLAEAIKTGQTAAVALKVLYALELYAEEEQTFQVLRRRQRIVRIEKKLRKVLKRLTAPLDSLSRRLKEWFEKTINWR